ncbi:hypothetical protein [Oerskovia turbata]
MAFLALLAFVAIGYATSGTWAWALAVRGVLPVSLRGFVAAGQGAGTWVLQSLAGLLGVALVAVVAHLLWRRGGVTAGVVVAVMAVGVLWPRPEIGAAERFAAYRDALGEVAALPRGTADGGAQGAETLLPPALRHVSADGRAEAREGGRVFVPQWLGMPDDAGGFWFSPGESPAGLDMRGMPCADPVRVEGDWWACGTG